MASPQDWPQELAPVHGPFSAERVAGAAAGMGPTGGATQALVDRGLLQPDLITGMTLFLLARQPRRPRTNESSRSAPAPKKASAIAGGVWVREQFTIHRPVTAVDAFTVTGASTGRYGRKGRRYGTTTSQSSDSSGRPIANNLTTGLLEYRVQEDLADVAEGLALEETPTPLPDHTAAAANPHLSELATATVGLQLGNDPIQISLAMMAARDTANPDNPIHSDLDAAKAAGLERPIAGGSHVLSFAIDAIMARFGEESLLHGAHFDVRWKAPTHADASITPGVTITHVDEAAIVFDIDTRLYDSTSAMVGTITVPLPS